MSRELTDLAQQVSVKIAELNAAHTALCKAIAAKNAEGVAAAFGIPPELVGTREATQKVAEVKTGDDYKIAAAAALHGPQPGELARMKQSLVELDGMAREISATGGLSSPPSSTSPGFFGKPPVARKVNNNGKPLVTEAEAKRLFAIARNSGWEVKRYIQLLADNFGVTHGFALPYEHYRKAEQLIKSGESAFPQGAAIDEDVPF